jgi:predicted metal-binding membrane protein
MRCKALLSLAVDGLAVGLRLVRAPDWFMPIMSGLIGLAWIALFLWEQSPYGRYLEHGQWTDIGLASAICRALPAGHVLLPMLLYTAGWLLMLAAMMLPTTLPLLQRFRHMVDARPDRVGLLALLIAGYMLAWVGFGMAAHALDAALHLFVRQSTWLLLHGWLIGAAILLIAGAFQFSQLKYRCLDRCRSPLSFITAHWRGVRPRHEAFRLGVDHGVFCVGCCWAIMLLMFVVGTGNVGWMLLLGAVMSIEKNAPWGRRLGRPLGAALIGWATLIVVGNLALSL